MVSYGKRAKCAGQLFKICEIQNLKSFFNDENLANKIHQRQPLASLPYRLSYVLAVLFYNEVTINLQKMFPNTCLSQAFKSMSNIS